MPIYDEMVSAVSETVSTPYQWCLRHYWISSTDASNGESHHNYLKLTVSFQAALIQRRCKLWTYKPLHGWEQKILNNLTGTYIISAVSDTTSSCLFEHLRNLNTEFERKYNSAAQKGTNRAEGKLKSRIIPFS